MPNFVSVVKAGKAGENFGLSTGNLKLDLSINKVQRATSYGIAAAPKVGKSKVVNSFFLYNTYLDALKLGIIDNVEYIYWSLEMDRVTQEFECAAFFMFHDYQIWQFEYNGEIHDIDGQYLQGKKTYEKDGEAQLIPLLPEHEELLKPIYLNRIIPLFGEWTEHNVQIKPGKVTFISEADNPTGMWKYLLRHAEKNGKFEYENFETKDDNGGVTIRKRRTGYIPKNPNKFTIVITDQVRKLVPERGFSLKQTVDKWIQYGVDIRNMRYYTFIDIIHTNRALSNVERLKYAAEYIYPTGDDTKETGNLSEECTIFMTLFNPGDEKYGIKKHFGVELADYPRYRSLHIVEARNVPCPIHMQFDMYGGVNHFFSIEHKNY